MKSDLLKMLDLSREDITEILDVADQMKYNQKHGLSHDYLRGKVLAMIFEKNSTRTRVSFETGMFQLGGHALFLSGKDSQRKSTRIPAQSIFHSAYHRIARCKRNILCRVFIFLHNLYFP